MNVTLEELKKINQVQIEILKSIVQVCSKLDIKFFMVHGSLLGTIRSESFIPYDDDIDIAIPREQYEKFLSEAPKLIGEHYFVQSELTEKNYPLEFAKVRDSRTTYIVDNIKHIDINHGIYVDVFPIDFTIKGTVARIIYKLLSLRISNTYINKSQSKVSKLKRALAVLLCPSLKYAIKKRNALLKSSPKGDKVRMTGGKATEKSMPAKWFCEFEERIFENIPVYVPKKYDEYLTHIYGNYKARTLVEGKMADPTHVELNAYIADADKPYTYYMDK